MGYPAANRVSLFGLFGYGNPEIAVEQPPGTDLRDGVASVDFGSGLGGSSAPLTFTVSFTPGNLGAQTAALHLTSNDSDESPFDITLTGTGVTPSEIAQHAYLKASNTGADDLFGSSVAVSGGTVVVGAYGERSNATGVNGNQADNSSASAGAVYLFTRRAIGPQLTILRDGSGGYLIRLQGFPGWSYRVQRAANLPGPWATSPPQTAPASGLVGFWDSFPPPGQAFYRVVQP